MNDHLGSMARSARGEGAALLPASPPVFLPTPEPLLGLREVEAEVPAVASTPVAGRRRHGRAALPYPTAASATGGRGSEDPWGPVPSGQVEPWAALEQPSAQAQPEALLGSSPEAPAGPPDQSVLQARAARSRREAAAFGDSVRPEAQNEGAQPLGRLEHLHVLDGARVREEIAPDLPLREQRPHPRVHDLGGMARPSATGPEPGGTIHVATQEQLEEQPTLGSAPGRPPTATVTGVRREPPEPTVSRRRPAADPTTAETVRVSIGRIEVRAVHPPAPPEPEPPRSRAPALSLDDYLRRRDGRGRG